MRRLHRVGQVDFGFLAATLIRLILLAAVLMLLLEHLGFERLDLGRALRKLVDFLLAVSVPVAAVSLELDLRPDSLSVHRYFTENLGITLGDLRVRVDESSER